MPHRNLIRAEGYWKALTDYGVYKNGVQCIGCFNESIDKVFNDYLFIVDITRKEFDDWLYGPARNGGL